MGVTSKTITLAFAGAGLALFSQAPEFTQQYRQRLGGAVEELKAVVDDFDRDASRSSLKREQALDEMLKSPTPFSRDRGRSMSGTLARFENLSQQLQGMDRADSVVRPLLVLRAPDIQVVQGAWRSFNPAVPLNTPGLVYGGIGALILAFLARMGIGSARAVRRRRATMVQGTGKIGDTVAASQAATSGAGGAGGVANVVEPYSHDRLVKLSQNAPSGVGERAGVGEAAGDGEASGKRDNENPAQPFRGAPDGSRSI